MFNTKKILAAVIILLWLTCVNFLIDIPNISLVGNQDEFNRMADWISLAVLIVLGITSGYLMWAGAKIFQPLVLISIVGYVFWRFVSDRVFYVDFIYTMSRGDVVTEIVQLWSTSKLTLIAAYYYNFFVPIALITLFVFGRKK